MSLEPLCEKSTVTTDTQGSVRCQTPTPSTVTSFKFPGENMLISRYLLMEDLHYNLNPFHCVYRVRPNIVLNKNISHLNMIRVPVPTRKLRNIGPRLKLLKGKSRT